MSYFHLDLQLLEQAAREIMSPPNILNQERRLQAEDLFLTFKKVPNPYEICKIILENSSSDYVLYQAASVFKESTVREWMQLSPSVRTSIRMYILQYLIDKPNLTNYVKQQLVVAVAVIVKRNALEDNFSNVIESFVSDVAQLFSFGNLQLSLLGCSLFSTLLVEFSSSTGSSALGMPLDFHISCRRAIERGTVLLQILGLTIQVLHRCTVSDLLSLEEWKLMKDATSLLLQIFEWDFHKKRYLPTRLDILESSFVPMRPPQFFSETLLDPSLLKLVFKILEKYWKHEEIFHIAGQLLDQLASLGGPVISSAIEERSYLTNFLDQLLCFLSTWTDLNQHILYYVSSSLRRLLAAFSAKQVLALDKELVGRFIRDLSERTVFCCQKNAVQSEVDGTGLYRESLDYFLEVLQQLIEESDSKLSEVLMHACLAVFIAYLRSKLSVPQGLRTPNMVENISFLFDQSDSTSYAAQLTSIGVVARSVPQQCLPLVVSSFEHCLSEYLHIVSELQQDHDHIKVHCSRINDLHEDLHWIFLIAGHILCDVVDGEEVAIPKHLLEYSSEQSAFAKEVDLQDLVVHCTPGSISSSDTDVLVKVIAVVAQWCVIESELIKQGFFQLLSPQVSESAVWFLSVIANPYLMKSKEVYEEASPSLLSVIGQHSKHAQWLLIFFLQKVIVNLSVWSSEESVAEMSVALLNSLTKERYRAAILLESEQMWSLMICLVNFHPPFSLLPNSILGKVATSLVSCAVGNKMEEFLKKLVEPLIQQFPPLLTQEEKVCNHKLLMILEVLTGLTQTVGSEKINMLFGIFHPLLCPVVSLLEVYSNAIDIVTSVLTFFSLLAENFALFLNDAYIVKLYEASLDLIHLYAKHHTGRYYKNLYPQDEQCEDLVLFVQILIHLTTKDYLDFSDKVSKCISPASVVMQGLMIIIPLLNENLLSIPLLQHHFYHLLHYVCEIFAEYVISLPKEMWFTLTNIILKGIESYDVDIVCKSVECVESLATTVRKDLSSESVYQTFETLLKVLVTHMFSATFNMELLTIYSGAVYMLICADKEVFSYLIEEFVTQNTTISDEQLVPTTLQFLSTSVLFNRSREGKDLFKKKLQDSILAIRAFVII